MNLEILENKDSYLQYNKIKGVNIYFTTKDGGVSQKNFASNNMAYQVGDDFTHVVVNRVMFSKKINVELDNFVFAHQTHKTNVYKVEKKDLGKGKEKFEDGIANTDVLYTYEKQVALACFYADCTPIYFIDQIKGLVGIIHAGWQGTVKNIVDKTIQTLQEKEGVEPKNLKFIIGPSIRKDSFIVHEDVYEQFKNQKHAQNEVIFENDIVNGDKTWKIDLVKYIQNSLIYNGVLEANILTSNIDTVKANNMFSFRQENKTGRMIAVIVKQ